MRNSHPSQDISTCTLKGHFSRKKASPLDVWTSGTVLKLTGLHARACTEQAHSLPGYGVTLADLIDGPLFSSSDHCARI